MRPIKHLVLLKTTNIMPIADSNVEYKEITLNTTEMCDLEMLLNGGFNPLCQFMDSEDFRSVTTNCRLANGSVWPVPVVLTAWDSMHDNHQADSFKDKMVNLLSDDNTIVATMQVVDIFETDPDEECRLVAGTTDVNHPYVQMVRARRSRWCVSGPLTKKGGVPHYNYTDLRKTPEETKAYLKQKVGDQPVMGFQTRNPMHRAHIELMLKSAQSVGAHPLLHPVVGATQPGDIDPDIRVRCYRHVVRNLEGRVDVSLVVLPIAMRMLGPREALWHALIRKNYGCTHFVVGRDHAGPSVKHSVTGEPFYDPFDAHRMVERFSSEIGIQVIMSPELVYVPTRGEYITKDQLEAGEETSSISGTKFRSMLANRDPIPEWFSFPDVIAELQKSAGRSQTGICVYFVGLSGSGKSTIANAVAEKLREVDSRIITNLDGDIVRKNLSKGLGFDKESRSTNVRRIGFVAYEIIKHGGTVFCANIAPYAEDREANRRLIKAARGKYLEVYVATPAHVCAERDVKGLYAKAYRDEIKLTGVNDPFDIPQNPDVVVDHTMTIEEAAQKVMAMISRVNFVCE
jgi:sulfate adenylyltransferase